MFGMLQRLQLRLRLHYELMAAVCLICVLIVAILDYGHVVYGCDLICWRRMLDKIEDKPMIVMVFIASLKLLLILIMTLLSYTQARPEIEPTITQVKRRYCRFILMRLLAAHDEFLQDNLEIEGRHEALMQAIQLFRADARKLCERTPSQLHQSIRQMLLVEEQQEQQLLQRGYNRCKCVTQLGDADIYRLALSLPLQN